MAIADLFKRKPVAGAPQPVDATNFETEVLQSAGPVLVDFWAPWCMPCRLVGGLLEELGPQYAGRMPILKLNVDDSPELAARFGVSSIPTMIIFRGGKEVDRVVGALPLNPLKQRIERHLPRTAPRAQDAPGPETAPRT